MPEGSKHFVDPARRFLEPAELIPGHTPAGRGRPLCFGEPALDRRGMPTHLGHFVPAEPAGARRRRGGRYRFKQHDHVRTDIADDVELTDEPRVDAERRAQHIGDRRVRRDPVGCEGDRRQARRWSGLRQDRGLLQARHHEPRGGGGRFLG